MIASIHHITPFHHRTYLPRGHPFNLCRSTVGNGCSSKADRSQRRWSHDIRRHSRLPPDVKHRPGQEAATDCTISSIICATDAILHPRSPSSPSSAHPHDLRRPHPGVKVESKPLYLCIKPQLQIESRDHCSSLDVTFSQAIRLNLLACGSCQRPFQRSDRARR